MSPFRLAGRTAGTVLLAGALLSPSGLAQEDDDGVLDLIQKLTSLTGFVLEGSGLDGVSFELTDQQRTALEQIFSGEQLDVATFSPLLQEITSRATELAILQDFDFRLKTFQVNGGDASIGLDFRYQKSLPVTPIGDDFELAFDIEADGILAFDADVIPNDFLRGRLAFDFFGSHGGEIVPGFLTEDERRELVALGDTLAFEEDLAVVRAQAQPWIERLQSGVLSNQFSWGVAVNTGFEADQSFSNRNFVFGGDAFLDWKPWNSQATASWFNVFDYPFALVRILTGHDRDFRLRGQTFPAVRVGVDRVLPSDDKTRQLTGDDSDYWRWRAEVSLKAPIGTIGEDVFFFSANYRYYEEISPSTAIKLADLDRNSFTTLTVGGDEGVFVSYSAGELPFGVRNAQVYELGWKFHF